MPNLAGFAGTPTEGGAIAATVVVQTDGSPRLQFLLFDGSPIGRTGNAAQLRVQVGGQQRNRRPDGHHDSDFLLNFLVFTTVPDHVSFPQAVSPVPGELGTGYSNSSYP